MCQNVSLSFMFGGVNSASTKIGCFQPAVFNTIFCSTGSRRIASKLKGTDHYYDSLCQVVIDR